MHKKIIMACMAIAAFAAFVVAPAASASPVLTDETPGGVVEPVAVGAWVTGTTTGEAVFTGPEIRCHGHLSGTVTENSGTKIKGTVGVGSAIFTGTGSGGDCTSSLGDVKVTVNSELCFETVKGTDTVLTTGCEGKVVTFTFDQTSLGISCKYSTSSVTGTFPTNAASTVNVSEQPAKKEEGGIFCPSEGKLDMDFDLYTTDGTPIFTS